MIRFPLIRQNTPSRGFFAGFFHRHVPVLSMPSLRRAATLAVMSASVVACGAPRDGVRLTEGATTVPSEEAMALPPPGGPAVVSVVSRTFTNADEQDILLFTSASTPGQNFLRIKLFGPMGIDRDGGKSLGYATLRESTIGQEMRAQFPGVGMKRSDLFLQNDYGPFGYAFGRGRQNDSCFYGWQQIRSNEQERSAFQNGGTIQVRLRLCEQGASEEKLLSVMYGYTIRAGISKPGWNPYGAPPSVDDGLGRTSNPIRPLPQDLEPARVTHVSRPIVTKVVPVRATQVENSTQLVPSPDGVQNPQAAETIPLPVTSDMNTVVVPSPSCVANSDGTPPC
ncbi:hypothetical protein QO002_004618 [Pararhizobium capsulatum DSM 1112]|uniref:Cellulose biosynthesis protein BcsN n=1 Tax=Pararhizobium capsulatum DSM 1112 TaxID=1121113 RepID=A0ABU0BWT4_9HYPH|nr:cellulose biosynthesis protein BcsN [Pararhizobium capsulatum]MDQ0322412.1 hypothetical protein [Pararhizobium capsulatum DSM 1112]